ncbi:uncharacterized protein LOC144466590 [Epinephelus lanceolatus]
MMAEFRWIIMSLFLMLLFKFTAAATEKYSLVGDEVTLSCENVTHDQDNCDSATWLFSAGGNTVTLFEHGKIHREAEAKSDRLSVTAKCSLVIKKVTREDVGRYTCRQFRSGRQVSDSQVYLSVVTSWWRFIVVSVGLAALIISVVTVNIWTRTKGNKTQMVENMEHIEEDEDEGTVNYENVRDPSASQGKRPGNIVRGWKEPFEELLNLTNTPSGDEAEFEDLGQASPISLAQLSEVGKQLLSPKMFSAAAGWTRITPDGRTCLERFGQLQSQGQRYSSENAPQFKVFRAVLLIGQGCVRTCGMMVLTSLKRIGAPLILKLMFPSASISYTKNTGHKAKVCVVDDDDGEDQERNMMAEFRWIIMSLFLMLLFKFTAAIEKYSLVGDEVTLSCENVTHDQDNCDSATWLFSDGGNTVKLFEHRKIHREAEAKSDRLSVTANCSLVIKKVTREDVGRYSCRQFRSGRQVSDSQVDLSVVDMTERQDTDRVIFFCSVWIYGHICTHTVKWLYESNQNDLETSQSTCVASVTFTTSDYNQKLKYSALLKCEVTDGHTKEVHQFTFSPPQSSGEKPGHNAATAATISTESPSTTGNKWTSVKRSTSEGWWRFIVVSVGLAALIISVVTVNIWTRTKGNKTQMDENMEHIEEDEDEGTVNYENVRDPSASV